MYFSIFFKLFDIWKIRCSIFGVLMAWLMCDLLLLRELALVCASSHQIHANVHQNRVNLALDCFKFTKKITNFRDALGFHKTPSESMFLLRYLTPRSCSYFLAIFSFQLFFQKQKQFRKGFWMFDFRTHEEP